jgi:predicted phosphodiesterase
MIALISDIHGNLDALTAVVKDIKSQGVQNIWCLGDIVGYGAEPSRCIDIVRETCARVVVGNHDKLAVGGDTLSFLSEHVSAGILYARASLSKSQYEWVNSLPYTIMEEGVTAVHASLFNPEDFSYLATDMEARLHFRSQSTQVSFVGHTHVPLITVENGSSILWKELGEQSVRIENIAKCSVNVGSVGQPRDDNPKASYAIYDQLNNMLYMRRIDYDIKKAQERIAEAGLPQINAARLSVGK